MGQVLEQAKPKTPNDRRYFVGESQGPEGAEET